MHFSVMIFAIYSLTSRYPDTCNPCLQYIVSQKEKNPKEIGTCHAQKSPQCAEWKFNQVVLHAITRFQRRLSPKYFFSCPFTSQCILTSHGIFEATMKLLWYTRHKLYYITANDIRLQEFIFAYLNTLIFFLSFLIMSKNHCG